MGSGQNLMLPGTDEKAGLSIFHHCFVNQQVLNLKFLWVSRLLSFIIRADPVYERNHVTMKKLPGKQRGASTIVTILLLAAIAYGVYIGIQYVPQAVESNTIDSILDGVESTQRGSTSVIAVRQQVTKMLQLNDMNDLTNSFSVESTGGVITVTFSYDRELNLGYKIKPMHYEKSLRLN